MSEEKKAFEELLQVATEEVSPNFLIQFMREQEQKKFGKDFRGTIGFLSTLPKSAADVVADNVETLVSVTELDALQKDFNKQAKALAELTGERKAEQDPKVLKNQRNDARAEAKALREGLAAMAESMGLSVSAFVAKFSDGALEDVNIVEIRKQAKTANRLVARLEVLQEVV